MIDFNIPPFTGKELEYMQQAIKIKKSAETASLPRNAAVGWKKNFRQTMYF